MCYSAQIWQQYRRYVRAYDSKIDIETFVELFWCRLQDDRVKIPKALEEAFNSPENEPEQHIKRLIDDYKVQQATKLEQALFQQRKRLADAQRSLLTKTTRAASEAQRIATNKVDWLLGKLAD